MKRANYTKYRQESKNPRIQEMSASSAMCPNRINVVIDTSDKENSPADCMSYSEWTEKGCYHDTHGKGCDQKRGCGQLHVRDIDEEDQNKYGEIQQVFGILREPNENLITNTKDISDQFAKQDRTFDKTSKHNVMVCIHALTHNCTNHKRQLILNRLSAHSLLPRASRSARIPTLAFTLILTC